MPIVLNGTTGVITGIPVGGLPDGIVDTDMLAANAVTAAKATGVGFTPEVNAFRIHTNFTGDTDPIQNWEVQDQAWEGQLGSTLVTESSGIWTFAKTGWYRLDLSHHWYSPHGNAQDWNNMFCRINTNSGVGSYPYILYTENFNPSDGTNYKKSTAATLFKVPNISTYRIKFTTEHNNQTTVNVANTIAMNTGFILTRFGDI